MGPSGWDVLPDLFFYRDPEEIEKEAADKAAAQAAAEGGDADAAAANAAGAVSSEWDAGQTADAVFNAQPTGNGESLFYVLVLLSFVRDNRLESDKEGLVWEW